jgi:DNA repair exonuclease SbcCD nuclease subunit
MLRTDSPESLPFDDFGVVVHGQGFSTQAVTEDLSLRYPQAIRGAYNIGILHTCAGGEVGHERYAPCTVPGLQAKGYDYWALGHVHTRQFLSREPYVVFPGNTQGRHARELGPKGCLLVTIDGTKTVDVEFRRLDVVRWETCQVDASTASTEEDLGDLAVAELSRLLQDEPSGRLLAVRVVIAGASPIHDRLLADPEKAASIVRSRASELGVDRLWVERIKIQTRPRRASLAGGDGPIEELSAVLEELRTDETRVKDLAGLFKDLRLKLPPELLEGPEALALDDPAWLRGAIDSAEALLLSRLHS